MPASNNYGADIASAAVNSGRQAINSFDPSATAMNQQNRTNSLFDTQQGQTRDYINRYSQAVASNPTVTSLYNQGNEMFNVPGLAKTANYLQNQVTNAIPDAYQGARGFDIGQTAINNGVASKLGYLTPQMNAATNNLNTAQGLAQGYVNAGQLQNQQNLLPIQSEQQNLLQAQAAQATGWNQAANNEFQGLLQKMQSGVQLSLAELERANQLAALQQAYKTAVQQSQATIKAAQIGQQYQTIGPGQTLANTFTGSIINPGILTGSRGYYQGG